MSENNKRKIIRILNRTLSDLMAVVATIGAVMATIGAVIADKGESLMNSLKVWVEQFRAALIDRMHDN